MRNLENAYRNAIPEGANLKPEIVESLLKVLARVRTVAHKDGGEESANYLRPLLDVIVQKQCDWSSSECARCHEALLKQYVPQNKLELLLAVSGYLQGYSELQPSAERRRKFAKAHLEDGYEIGEKAWEKREKKALSVMVSKMETDYDKDPTKLMDVVLNALNPQELKALGLWEVSNTALNSSEQSEANISHLKRAGKIFNISQTDDLFVGKTRALKALQDGFKEGYKAQILGAERIRGKSRLALEYARLHADEYQIICWINAWNEECIQSSILKFFDIAGVAVQPLTSGQIKETFLNFFRINTNWLIVFDNAEIATSLQKEMLESYMPSTLGGHTIITANMHRGIGEYKFHFLDDLTDPNEAVTFMQKVLETDLLDKATADLAAMCGSDLHFPALMAAYMRKTEQMDTATYLRLLSNYGCRLNDPNSGPFLFAAFDIMMHYVQIKMHCSRNTELYRAIQQVLIAYPIFMYCSVDLDFLCCEFPILPDPLKSIYVKAETREQLIAGLRDFGIYEIADGVFQFHNMLRSLIASDYSRPESNDFCLKLLDAMNTAICEIHERNGGEMILTRAKPYIDRICTVASLEAGISTEKMESKYSAVWELSYCKEWT